MTNPDQIETWLNSVAYEHSQSKTTEYQYRRIWNRFSQSTQMTAQDIIKDYENAEKNNTSERTLKRKHSQKIQQWIIELTNKKLTTSTIKVMVAVIMSFYKYNDLPLGHIPQAKSGTTYHNKDITKDEINKISAISPTREKAVFAIMAQSGLRPHTIIQLKIKNMEKILEPSTPIPCKISVPREIEKGKFGTGHPTFIGQEAIKYTKQYLATRTNLTPESLLFATKHEKPLSTKNISRTFRISAIKLNETGAINYQIRIKKPSELRLYILRKYFRKYANQMGFEHVNYLMNHVTPGSDNTYTPRDDEFYRDLYKTQAMPHLRLETSTATENENRLEQIKQQYQKEIEQRDNENKELRNQIENIQQNINKLWEALTKYPRTVIEPIKNENAIKELLSTPEENQIDLTPNQQNIKLRRKLITKTKTGKKTSKVNKDVP